MRLGLVAVVLLVAGVFWLGEMTPIRTAAAETVSLGPEQGESVDDYVAGARDGLHLAGVDGDRWALVSLATGATPGLGALRISRVLVHVGIPGVTTAVSTVDVSGQGPVGDSVAGAYAVAASGQQAVAASPGRVGAVAEVVAGRLRAGCDCVAGLVVRGSPSALIALELDRGVRAVDVAPSGTSWGSLAVRPLLPEQVGIVGPGADDGPVPAS